MRRSQERWLSPLQLTVRLVPIVLAFFNVPTESLEGVAGNFAHPSSSLETLSTSASKRPASDPNFSSSVKKHRAGVSVDVQPIPEFLRYDNLASHSQTQYQLSQVLRQQHPAVSMSGTNARHFYDLMSTSDTRQPTSDLEPIRRLKQTSTEPRPNSPQPAVGSQPTPSPSHSLRINTVPQHKAVDFASVYQKTASVLPEVRLQFNLSPGIDALRDRLLKECQRRFSVQAEAALATYNRLVGKSTVHPFDGVRADLITFAAETGQAPIILLKPKSLTSGVDYEEPDSIQKSLYPLFKWILTNSINFWSEVGKQEEFIYAIHLRIIQWLIQQFFQPEHTIPVLGEVKSGILTIPPPNFDTFGPIQKRFIGYIYNHKRMRNSSKIAVNFLKFWYKNVDSSIWNESFNNYGHPFSRLLEDSQDLDDHNTVNPGSKIKPSPLASENMLGTLYLHDISRACEPGTLSQQHIEEALGQIREISFKAHQEQDKLIKDARKAIIDDMKFIYASCEQSKVHQKATFSDVTIGLIPQKNPQSSLKSHVIRLLTATNQVVICPAKMERKLSAFCNRLESYLNALIALSKLEGKYLIPNAHVNLFKWLHQELFSPTSGLPVIGFVKTIFDTYERNTFEPLQIGIIHYLTKQTPQPLLQQVFSSILGYWYKTFHERIWEKNFKNGEEYWKLMGPVAVLFPFPR